MSKFLNCCLKSRVSKQSPPHSPQESRDIMENPSSSSNVDNGCQSEKLTDVSKDASPNLILNHDFSGGLDLWHPNSCHAFIVSPESNYPQEKSVNLTGLFAVITNRTESWQGLEQDITSRVSPNLTYTVCAWVGTSSGSHQNVQATLKIENKDSSINYLFIARTSASMDRWEKLEGTFMLSSMPRRVIFYLEGPSSGVDLLIKSVTVSSPDSNQHDSRGTGHLCDDDENMIQNPSFDDGVNYWSGRGCNVAVHDSLSDGKILPSSGKFFISTSNRTQNWNGILQEITGRVQRKLCYEVLAVVRIFGNNVTTAEVQATLWVKTTDQREQYIRIGKLQATDKDWAQLQGKFLLNGFPSQVNIFLEGPPAGTDILLNNLVVKHATKPPPPTPPSTENVAFGVNVIVNSNLNDGTNGWFPLGNCTLTVKTGSPHILPPMARDSLGAHEILSGRFILVTNRTQNWMGPAQMITDKLKLYVTYQVSGWVRIGSGATQPQNVNVAFGVDGQWVNGGQVEIDDDKWHEIGGSIRIEKQPVKVMVYIQGPDGGPDGGVDLMMAGVQIFPVDRKARFRHLKRQTEKIRKRDVILKFNSSDPTTLLGTSIKIRQTQNSFPIGSCFERSAVDNEEFVEFFSKNFNWAVFANELKWYWTEAQQGNLNYNDSDLMLDFCNNRNILVRGHCIFWEVEDAVQSWIKSLTRADMKVAVQNRLTSLLTRYKGKFKHYDVNNEMLHGSFFKDHLGKDIRADMFKIANQLDSSPTLFVNDYNVENGSDVKATPDKYIEHVLNLQEQGAPVGGIGLQGHVINPVGPIVCSALDKLGILGLPIWFTELDVGSDNEFVRGEDLEVMLREAFAHPAVEGVMLWGFWELFMSQVNGHLVNAEGDVNEAGKKFLELKKEWLTYVHGSIDEEGKFGFRGFYGTYEVDVVGLGKKKGDATFVVEQGEDPVVISVNL